MRRPLAILMVVTNHCDIGGTPMTGVWFTEFSEPYAALLAADAQVTVASPRGGPAPIDPRGYPSREDIAGVRDALAALNATVHLDRVNIDEFDGLFFPGGHGPMFDLASDATAKRCIAAAWAARKPIAAVCHGPAALLDVALSSGTTLLNGRRVTGFTRGEDAADALFAYMPFSLQDRMTAEGAKFVAQPPRSVHVEIDGLLVTGQNPASAAATAEAFVSVLRSKGA
ncbi:type 1 glutamine amidotransferase domain-containing protein [Mycobacterium sp. ML4]